MALHGGPRISHARVPKVRIRELTEDYCEFVLYDTDASVANAVRRVIIAEVGEVADCCVGLVLCSGIARPSTLAYAGGHDRDRPGRDREQHDRAER